MADHHCPFCAHPMPYATQEALAAPWRGMWQTVVAYEAEHNPAGIPTAGRAQPDRG